MYHTKTASIHTVRWLYSLYGFWGYNHFSYVSFHLWAFSLADFTVVSQVSHFVVHQKSCVVGDREISWVRAWAIWHAPDLFLAQTQIPACQFCYIPPFPYKPRYPLLLNASDPGNLTLNNFRQPMDSVCLYVNLDSSRSIGDILKVQFHSHETYF